MRGWVIGYIWGGGYCQELRRLLYSHGLARRGRKVTGCDMSGRGAWVGDWVYIWVLGGGGRGYCQELRRLLYSHGLARRGRKVTVAVI